MARKTKTTTETAKTKPSMFTARVAAAMAEQDHDITAAAKGAGITRSMLSRWLTGKRDMSVSKLERLYKYLGIKP